MLPRLSLSLLYLLQYTSYSICFLLFELGISYRSAQITGYLLRPSPILLFVINLKGKRRTTAAARTVDRSYKLTTAAVQEIKIMGVTDNRLICQRLATCNPVRGSSHSIEKISVTNFVLLCRSHVLSSSEPAQRKSVIYHHYDTVSIYFPNISETTYVGPIAPSSISET